MAIQQSQDPVKSTVMGPTLVALKFKFTNAASNAGVTLLSGQAIINNGGSVVITTNTNACVATITWNSSILDIPWIAPEVRDDGQTGIWASVGNITNEAPNLSTSLCTAKVALWNSGGTSITTNNVNANTVVVSVLMMVQNTGPKPLTPGS